MGTPPPDPHATGQRATANPPDIGYLHHTGHVVGDMTAAIALYRRLGFEPAPPTYPALPAESGGAPVPFGAGNARVVFARNFLELATVVDDPTVVDDDATLVPLEVPPEALPRVMATVERTVARLASALNRFEGLHILALRTPDVDATAERLTAEGVAHGGVTQVGHPVTTEEGTRTVVLRFVELDAESGYTPEGRLVVAEDPGTGPTHAGPAPDHPNGAVDLAGVVMCVPDADLHSHERRYTSYLRRGARDDGPARVFDLDGAQVTLVAERDLDALLPGERAPEPPCFVAQVVTVADLAATRRLLETRGVAVRESGSGDLFVPAHAALGTAVVFRADSAAP